MQGMTLPRPGSPREEWTDAESLAVELLNLASWLTQRTIYDADRNLRKGVALDETHFLSQVPTGKVLIDRLARDSRKFNVRALFASQLAGDLLRVSGFASLVNAVFVGRTDDEEAQAEALRLLRVPDRRRLRADARHAVAAAAARRPARRHARASSSSPTGTAASRRSGSTSRRRTWSTCGRRSTRTRTPAGSPSAAIPGGGGTAGPGRARPARRGGRTSAPRPPAARSAPATVPGTLAPLPAVDAELLDDEDLDLFDDLDDAAGRGRPPATATATATANGNGIGRGRCPAARAATGYPGGAVR